MILFVGQTILITLATIYHQHHTRTLNARNRDDHDAATYWRKIKDMT